ncbi:hypothetical protein F2Q69_00052618 [Brassica cretica]|uniref:Uncharacterized protein n=1 Tax=Brassica cretica TaxID=69181 RepID=A0A8S9MUY1_BRACR|nr:hypothetical protein F2Q69_00052618 [Brassica cretica]
MPADEKTAQIEEPTEVQAEEVEAAENIPPMVRVYTPKLPYPVKQGKSRRDLEAAKCKEMVSELNVKLSFEDAVEMMPALKRYVKSLDRTIFKLKDKCKELSKTVKRQAEASAQFMKNVAVILTRGAVAGCSSSDFDFLTPQPQPPIDPLALKKPSMDRAGTTTRDAVPARTKLEKRDDTATRGGAARVPLPALSMRYRQWITRGRRRGMLYPLA